MAGKFNDVSEWDIIPPRTRVSKLTTFDQSMVVIVSGRKVKCFYLPMKVLHALGEPKFVKVLRRKSQPNIIGIVATDENDPKRFKVASPTFDGRRSGMPKIVAGAFIRENRIGVGAYTARVENGVLMFDINSTPSEL